MSFLNILSSGSHLPTAVLEIVDWSGHVLDGLKNYSSYIAKLFLPYIEDFGTSKKLVDLVYFDCAWNVQKAGEIIAALFPRVTSCHVSEHVVSLFYWNFKTNKNQESNQAVSEHI